MKTDQPIIIRREDYRAHPFRINEIAMTVALDPKATRVTATLQVEAQGDGPHDKLVLDGEAMTLRHVAIDGVALERSAYAVSKTSLTIKKPPRRFTLTTEVEIDPAANTQLSGLYLSNGIFCTQCEAEGFRRITYFIDRPDNMAVFRVRVEGDAAQLPLLLANGNPVARGKLPSGRHFVEWHDPFPKPSYLFALVAGNLGFIEDHFRTRSGRNVLLQIYVEPGNESKASYAMEALKRSMTFDEEAFGREYDLDIFMIVAVSAFNFGAMENKGLNIFNDKYILADQETATDVDFNLIESVVAHEYFHNWSGNRVTCRDWFQLCLKEGLTVFRDQSFSEAMNSEAVERIGDVKTLRTRQFPEDQGPLAHPARPDSFVTIDNFYTATVYEKGAEICRMLRAVLTPEGFRKGLDLYFERHDGEAATVDQFAQAFEDATGADLNQFRLWWSQAGTPHLDVKGRFDATARVYEMTVTQSTPPTPGQSQKHPLHMPLRISLLNDKGEPYPLSLDGEMPGKGPEERVLHLTRPKHVFRFTGISARPVPSLNRGFSAPVKLSTNLAPKDRAFLMGHDTDLFGRWEAGQAYARDLLTGLTAQAKAKKPLKVDKAFLDAVGSVLADAHRDRALTALALQMPSELELAQDLTPADPDAIHQARSHLVGAIGKAHRERFLDLYAALATNEPYRPDADQSGRRALRNMCLRYLASQKGAADIERVQSHYAQATNMTDRAAALSILSDFDEAARAEAFDHFFERFEKDPLVTDKWLTLQALSAAPDTLARVKALTQHKAFSFRNPNRFRSLVGAFAFNNPLRFHDKSGAGYRFVADMVLKMDSINPQVAARLTGAFETWRNFDRKRQGLIKAELARILDAKGLSKNTAEMAGRALGETG